MSLDPGSEVTDEGSAYPLSPGRRLRRALFGRPRDLADRRLFHRLALVPFLAWVGLGADGLSSSAYGPEEAFKALGEHRFLAVGLVLLMATTVLLISAAYRRIIEEFPSGGGGYLVASKLLGPSVGVVSGSALLVDYALTITTSLAAAADALYRELGDLTQLPRSAAETPALDRTLPTAAVLVASYGGLGIHTLLNIFRAFPDYYRQAVFISVGVVDSGEFKGEDALEELRRRTQETLDRYVALASTLGVAATGRMALGTDVVEAAEELCRGVSREFPRATFFSGRLIFQRDRWYQRLLHNETALAIQKRLQWAGRTMVLMPIRVRS